MGPLPWSAHGSGGRVTGVYSSGDESWGPVYKWLCIRAPPAPRPLLLSPGWLLFKNATSGLRLQKFSFSPALRLAVSCNPVVTLGVVKACVTLLWLRGHAVTHPVAANSRSLLSHGSGGPTPEISSTEQTKVSSPAKALGRTRSLGSLSEAASSTLKANSLASSSVCLLRLSPCLFLKKKYVLLIF